MQRSQEAMLGYLQNESQVTHRAKEVERDLETWSFFAGPAQWCSRENMVLKAVSGTEPEGRLSPNTSGTERYPGSPRNTIEEVEMGQRQRLLKVLESGAKDMKFGIKQHYTWLSALPLISYGTLASLYLNSVKHHFPILTCRISVSIKWEDVCNQYHDWLIIGTPELEKSAAYGLFDKVLNQLRDSHRAWGGESQGIMRKAKLEDMSQGFVTVGFPFRLLEVDRLTHPVTISDWSLCARTKQTL